MKATDARKITTENLKGPVIQPSLDMIYNKIKLAAKNGESNVIDPYRGMLNLTTEKKRAIEGRLREDGYQITESPAYDDGPGRYSPAYITISW